MGNIQNRSYEPFYKTNTKNGAKRLTETTFVIAKLDRAITIWGVIEKLTF